MDKASSNSYSIYSNANFIQTNESSLYKLYGQGLLKNTTVKVRLGIPFCLSSLILWVIVNSSSHDTFMFGHHNLIVKQNTVTLWPCDKLSVSSILPQVLFCAVLAFFLLQAVSEECNHFWSCKTVSLYTDIFVKHCDTSYNRGRLTNMMTWGRLPIVSTNHYWTF